MDRKLVVAATAMLVAFSLISGCVTPPGDEPAVEITDPQEGATVSGNVTISVDVTNFTMVSDPGNATDGDGYLVYYKDVEAPSDPNASAYTDPGTYAISINTSYTWMNVSAGNHTFSVSLVDTNDTPIDPPAIATVNVTVQQNGTNGTGNGTVYALVTGWYRGQEIQYYDFGQNSTLTDNDTVATAPLYVFVSNASGAQPTPIQGQHNIVDVLPGDQGYSDLWQVVYVHVPSSYENDSIRSFEDLQQTNYTMNETDVYLNCPIVPENSTFEGNETLVQGWYRGEPVFYVNFGENPNTTAPIYVLITGMDGQGNPQMVQNQSNIIDVVPGDTGYSDFWRVWFVTVPQNYTAGTLKSFEDVNASGYPTNETQTVVNCPVVNATM